MALYRKCLLTNDLKVCLISKFWRLCRYLSVTDFWTKFIWSENILYMILIFCFFNLLKFYFVFNETRYDLSWVNIPCAFEKNLLFFLGGGGVSYMYQLDSFIWLMVLFSTYISLLIFNLIFLLITEKEILKSPAIITYMSFSPFGSVNFCFTYFKTVDNVYTHSGLLCLLGELMLFSLYKVSFHR